MNDSLLEITDLQVAVEGKVVVDQLQLKIERARVVVLLGSNGSGKSSLAMALMGDLRFKIQELSKAMFKGKDLLKMSSDERAKAGLFVAWQSPMMIPGVSVFSLCKAAYESQGNTIDKLTDFKQKLEQLAVKVGLGREYVSRGVNEGFSGGERKRLELLQLLLLEPKLAILDEIDSGLDADGVGRLGLIVNEMKKAGTSFILITHNKTLLHEVEIDQTWEMKHGQLQTRV